MMQNLLRFYDWISVGRDALAGFGVLANLLRGMPLVGMIAGYSIDAAVGGIVGGAGGLIAIAIVFVGVVVGASRELPIKLAVAAVPRDAGSQGVSGVVRSADSTASVAVGGWLSAALTGSVEDDDGEEPYRMTGLRAEFSKMLLGFVPVRVASLSADQFGGLPPDSKLDWLLPANGASQVMQVYFSSDEAQFNPRMKLEPGERLWARLVAEFGRPHRNVYVQFPERVEVRPVNVGGLLDAN